MIGSQKYQLSNEAMDFYKYVVSKIDQNKYKHITNPCGEASLHQRGGYCILGELAPFFHNELNDILHSGALAARFLVRTNLMNSIYYEEVKRTNRIGVSMTGIHEFAWRFFGYGFYDLIDENYSQDFWDFIKTLRQTVERSASEYAIKIGMNIPHTFTAIKPSGTVSKLFGLTEGAHLPEYDYYLRWTQFQNGSPLLDQYRREGYPVRELNTYPNVSIVGFPMLPLISTLGMGDNLTLASDVSPEDHYQWLMLLEKYWLGEGTNQQISYTLKLNVDKYSLDYFRKVVAEKQSQVRCCAILPQLSDEKLASIYEYLPNEKITKERYDEVVANIQNKKLEVQFSEADLLCAGGACPL